MTNWSNEAKRAVVRGIGYRVARGLPWPVAVILLILIILFGGDFR